jgi:hypothetical protein
MKGLRASRDELLRNCCRNKKEWPVFPASATDRRADMEYMGFILFLAIVGGASVALAVVDRVANSANQATRQRHAAEPVRQS